MISKIFTVELVAVNSLKAEDKTCQVPMRRRDDYWYTGTKSVWIRFPEERWQHILREHPELEGLYEDVLTTIESPLKVLAGSGGELLAAREIVPGKFLVVVYKEIGSDDGFVITAFLTRRVRQLERRAIVWPRQ